MPQVKQQNIKKRGETERTTRSRTHGDEMARQDTRKLAAETVECAALALESIDDIHGRHSLPTSVLGVSDRITNDVIKESLENTTGLIIDNTADTLHTTTTSETADCGLGDALNGVTKELAMTLCTLCTLATKRKRLATLTTARHS